MGKLKISLENIQGKMSRMEMKNVLGGKLQLLGYKCTRYSGNQTATIYTESPSVASSWSSAWNSLGWSTNCDGVYSDDGTSFV
jgi:hypothetical protein